MAPIPRRFNGACGSGFNFGSIDLGSPDYVLADADFTTSKIQWKANEAKLTITLGGSPATLVVTTVANAVYTPAAALVDLGGNPIDGTASHSAGGAGSHF